MPPSSSRDGRRTTEQRATTDGGKEEHVRGMAGIPGLLSSLSTAPSLTHTMQFPSLLQLDFASSSPTLPLIVRRRGVEKYGLEQEEKMRESWASSISGPLCVLADSFDLCHKVLDENLGRLSLMKYTRKIQETWLVIYSCQRKRREFSGQC
ncbi:uncharacterized protein [Lolium perenne]|uniref:uncharacterized protein n=1 Tax=Lolium perenne TaxID=4522 RepID=UPI003A990C5A